MLVKASILFFLLQASSFAQNSFQSELEMLEKSSKDIDISNWDIAQQGDNSSQDSISLSSSALQKEELPPTQNKVLKEQTKQSEIKRIRKRSR
ncbi:hypothetical protein [Halobacteriovorax sp. HLS]|uniref:hypothetical protein n=1 Tax=Halobacteriovorax sp. HLS TaxID=2234000 RepID=UPI000FDC16DE|nr:hypothetical protein [Halobacteriovorax sp. HLS]